LLRYKLAAIILFSDKLKVPLDNLRFCWENESNFDISPTQTTSLSRTKTLVVIGYSFPSINHIMDKLIIKKMKDLRTVYFQGKDKRDSERIMDSFKAIHGKWQNLGLFPIESAGYFIPPETTLGFDIPKGPSVRIARKE